MNYLLTIVFVHHVNPVMDPGIFGERLAGFGNEPMTLVDQDLDHYQDPEHDICFFSNSLRYWRYL